MRKIQRRKRSLSLVLPVCGPLPACGAQAELASCPAPMDPRCDTCTHQVEDRPASISGASPAGDTYSLESTVNRALQGHAAIDEDIGRFNQRTTQINVVQAG